MMRPRAIPGRIAGKIRKLRALSSTNVIGDPSINLDQRGFVIGSTGGGVTSGKAGGVPIFAEPKILVVPLVVLMEPTTPTIVQLAAEQEAVPVVVV